jgi:hypothetical protein
MRHLLLLSLHFALFAQEPGPRAAITITSDLPARLEIDGQPLANLNSNKAFQLETTPGEHQIIAHPLPTGPVWRKLIQVSSALPNTLNIPLQAHLLRHEIQSRGFWLDPTRKLAWAAADNGSGVTVSQAQTYCRQLAIAGHSDWRLPEIDELQPLFGSTPNEKGFRVIAPLTLSGWAWSATTGNEPAENWALDFGDGARASVAAGDAGLNRALCVRSLEVPHPPLPKQKVSAQQH